MTVFYRQNPQQITLLGQTYPLRQQIKSMGGQFNSQRKVWWLPFTEESLQQVKELCENLGGGAVSYQGLQNSPTPSTARALAPKEPAVQPSVNSAVSEKPSSLTVKQLLSQVSFALHRHFSAPVWVVGEVDGVNRRASGVFLTLAEEGNSAKSGNSITINSVLWSNTLKTLHDKLGSEALQAVLSEGVQIRCLCQVAFYEGRGQVSLTILDIDSSYTEGMLALKRKQLVKSLKQANLYDRNRQCQLPLLPMTIGLVTAGESRAQGDFLDQLAQKGFSGTVKWVHAPMQGEQVLKSVPEALAQLKGKVDLLVLTRGGGSQADLRWFDSYEVSHAIATCDCPVLAAIGHHDDLSIAEEIAFQREKTPTAAAEYICGLFKKVLERVNQHKVQLHHNLGRSVALADEALSRRVQLLSHGVYSMGARQNLKLQKQSELLLKGVARRLNSEEAKLLKSKWQLEQGAQSTVQQAERTLLSKHHQIEKKDPKEWLARGWTQLWSEAGIVASVKDAQLQDKLTAVFKDGSLDLTVDKIVRKKRNK